MAWAARPDLQSASILNADAWQYTPPFSNSPGIHGANSDTPPRLLREVYAKPFQAAITEAGLKCVMPCYNAHVR